MEAEPEPRLALRNVKLHASKWEIRAFLEGLGVLPREIQCCKMDKTITPRHQTVFADLETDPWLNLDMSIPCYLRQVLLETSVT